MLLKSGMISIDHLRSILDIRYVLIGGALKNTAGTGLPASLSDIWGNRYVQVCRIAEGAEADVIEPCIGRQMFWNDGSGGTEIIVEEYRDEARRSEMLRVRHDSCEKMLVGYDNTGGSQKRGIGCFRVSYRHHGGELIHGLSGKFSKNELGINGRVWRNDHLHSGGFGLRAF